MIAGEVKLADNDFQLADKQRQVERWYTATVSEIHQQDVVKHAQKCKWVARRRCVHHFCTK